MTSQVEVQSADPIFKEAGLFSFCWKHSDTFGENQVWSFRNSVACLFMENCRLTYEARYQRVDTNFSFFHL